MWQIILIALLVLAVCSALYLGAVVLRLRQDKKTLKMELETRVAQSMNIHDRLVKSETLRRGLVSELDSAHKHLELALSQEAVQGPYNDVAVEIGLNGVVYQFHKLEEDTHG